MERVGSRSRGELVGRAYTCRHFCRGTTVSVVPFAGCVVLAGVLSEFFARARAVAVFLQTDVLPFVRPPRRSGVGVHEGVAAVTRWLPSVCLRRFNP